MNRQTNRAPAESTAGLSDDEAEAQRYNPPEQPALVYRTGTYASLLQRMLDRVHTSTIPDGPNRGTRPLQHLNTTAYHDLVLAIFKSWALVGDVLTFYQERIANEGYLRTATERQSVFELVRAIDYEPRPGLAAGAYLAFTVLDAEGAPDRVLVPAGTAIQSVPAAGQMPVTFETSAPIEARASWNALRAYVPTVVRGQQIGRDATEIWIKGARPGLQPGLPLLIGGRRSGAGAGATAWYFRTVQKVEANHAESYTRLIWDAGLEGDDTFILNDPWACLLRQKAPLFGHDAPKWSKLPDAVKQQYAVRRGGVWCSADDGTSWSPASVGLPDAAIQALAADERGCLFAGTASGMFYSSDRGLTWQALPVAAVKKDVLCLSVAPGGHLFAGTATGEVFRSTDAGDKWESPPGGVALTQDGQRWKPLNGRLPKTVIRCLAAYVAGDNQSYLLAGTDKGIFRTTTDGGMWQAINQGLPGHSADTGFATVVAHALLVDNDRIYAGTDQGVYMSRDQGRHWEACNRGLPDRAAPADPASRADPCAPAHRRTWRAKDRGGLHAGLLRRRGPDIRIRRHRPGHLSVDG